MTFVHVNVFSYTLHFTLEYKCPQILTYCIFVSLLLSLTCKCIGGGKKFRQCIPVSAFNLRNIINFIYQVWSGHLFALHCCTYLHLPGFSRRTRERERGGGGGSRSAFALVPRAQASQGSFSATFWFVTHQKPGVADLPLVPLSPDTRLLLGFNNQPCHHPPPPPPPPPPCLLLPSSSCSSSSCLFVFALSCTPTPLHIPPSVSRGSRLWSRHSEMCPCHS